MNSRTPRTNVAVLRIAIIVAFALMTSFSIVLGATGTTAEYASTLTPRVYLPMVMTGFNPQWTRTPTSSATVTATSTRTSTSASAPTSTPTNTPTATPSSTPTENPTATATSTSTSTSTATPTSTPTSTPTDTPTSTPTSTPTDTPTNTPTSTPTDTPTNTPTPTATPCATLSGVLGSDATLVEGCIYNVIGNVLVPENISLTIPAQVTLRFNAGIYLRVDGSLVAVGTQEYPVKFTRGGGGYWGGVQITSKSGTSSVLDSVLLEYAEGTSGTSRKMFSLDIEGAQPQLSRIALRYNISPLYLGAGNGHTAVIQNSTIISNTGYVFLGFGQNTLKNSYLQGNTNSGYSMGTVRMCAGNTVSDSTFVNNKAVAVNVVDCAQRGTSRIERNTIHGNSGAILVQTGTVIIDHNDITGNSQAHDGWSFDFEYTKAAIALGGNYVGSVVTSNNIYENTAEFALRLMTETSDTLDATGNWWGTAESNEISSLIYDYYDDFMVGKANYQPFATEAILGAGAP